jgi:hypothetical protein
MKRDLDPRLVAERLAALARLYVPETRAEGRERLAKERPPSRESFEEAVARRLGELRALDELTRYLHRGRLTARPHRP